MRTSTKRLLDQPQVDIVIASRRVASIREDLSTQRPSRRASPARDAAVAEPSGKVCWQRRGGQACGQGAGGPQQQRRWAAAAAEIAAALRGGIATSADSYATRRHYAMRDQQQQQQQQLDMQEEALDGRCAAVGRIGSFGWSDKLMQSRMMSSLEDQVDGATVCATTTAEGQDEGDGRPKRRGVLRDLNLMKCVFTSLLYTCSERRARRRGSAPDLERLRTCARLGEREVRLFVYNSFVDDTHSSSGSHIDGEYRARARAGRYTRTRPAPTHTREPRVPIAQ